MLLRRPTIALRPYVDWVWSIEARPGTPTAAREISLPGGSHTIVIRSRTPLRIFATAQDGIGREIGTAVLGGMRLRSIRKDLPGDASVGAVLRPDAIVLLRKGAASQFAGRHTALGDVWTDSQTLDAISQIQADPDSRLRLERFERLLSHLFQDAIPPDPVVRHAILQLDRGARIDALAAEVGLSHRHFCSRFRDAVGLLPVDYRQLRRFDRLAASLCQAQRLNLAELALDVGYSDQAHMARGFRAFSGLSPRRYRQMSPTHARHIASD